MRISEEKYDELVRMYKEESFSKNEKKYFLDTFGPYIRVYIDKDQISLRNLKTQIIINKLEDNWFVMKKFYSKIDQDSDFENLGMSYHKFDGIDDLKSTLFKYKIF